MIPPLLMVLVSAGLLSGCSSSRGLSRSFRLSAVDVNRLPEGRRHERSASRPPRADEVDSPEDGELELASAHASKEDRFVVQADELDDDDARDFEVIRGVRPNGVRVKDVRPPVRSEPTVVDEVLAVLLTGYREEKSDAADDAASHPAAAPGVRFEVPPELPGSEAPPLRVPMSDPKQSFEERKAEIARLYGSVPELPPFADDDPSLPMWTLAELEHVAWENHPALMQAAAQMEMARGETIQAGLHPNPTVGWEQDTIANGIQGYNGPFWSQEIVTGGKLKLARSAASMDYENARIAYEKTKIEIATQVRTAHYELLVAQRRRRMLAALARLTDEIYQAQIELVAGSQAAAYEPLQVRVFAVQARNAVIEAHFHVIAAGRRLGAATGMPDLEQFRIAGVADDAPTLLAFSTARAYLLENHTELRTVRNRIVQAQFLARLEYIRPRIPNLSYYQTVQHATEVGPFVNSYNLQIGAPIPIFDCNQGNILATQSSIISNERAYGAAQNALIGRLAEVFARFETARAQADNYRRQMLPDQVRTYRGVYSRYREAGPMNDNINFGDVIVAQQTLGTVVSEYAGVLSRMWQAYVDAAELLQMEDLRTMDAWFGAGAEEIVPLPAAVD